MQWTICIFTFDFITFRINRILLNWFPNPTSIKSYNRLNISIQLFWPIWILTWLIDWIILISDLSSSHPLKFSYIRSTSCIFNIMDQTQVKPSTCRVRCINIALFLMLAVVSYVQHQLVWRWTNKLIWCILCR